MKLRLPIVVFATLAPAFASASDEKSAPFDEKPQRETLHFWLCGRCASKMTLVLEPARGLRLISLDERNANTSEMPIAMEGPPAKEC